VQQASTFGPAGAEPSHRAEGVITAQPGAARLHQVRPARSGPRTVKLIKLEIGCSRTPPAAPRGTQLGRAPRLRRALSESTQHQKSIRPCGRLGHQHGPPQPQPFLEQLDVHAQSTWRSTAAARSARVQPASSHSAHQRDSAVGVKARKRRQVSIRPRSARAPAAASTTPSPPARPARKSTDKAWPGPAAIGIHLELGLAAGHRPAGPVATVRNQAAVNGPEPVGAWPSFQNLMRPSENAILLAQTLSAWRSTRF